MAINVIENKPWIMIKYIIINVKLMVLFFKMYTIVFIVQSFTLYLSQKYFYVFFIDAFQFYFC